MTGWNQAGQRGWRLPGALPIVLVLAGCAAPSRPPAPPPPSAPAPADVTADGVHELVRASEAKVVVVALWATWCGPCHEEMPELLGLRRDHGGDVDLILVSLDTEAPGRVVGRFLARHGVDFPTYRNSSADQAFVRAIHPDWDGSIPATLVHGADRELSAFLVGRHSRAELDAAVRTALGG